MNSLTREKIRDFATNPEVYSRGRKYFREGRVVKFSFDDEFFCAYATVLGSDEYEAEVCFFDNGDIANIFCDCPAFFQFDGACKHIVALLEECRSRFSGREKARPAERHDKQELGNIILNYFERRTENAGKRPLRLGVTIEISTNKYGNEVAPYLSLRLGEGKLYVVKNLKKLFQAIKNNEELEFGKKFTFSPAAHTFSDEDRAVIDLLHELYEIEEVTGNNHYRWQYGRDKFFNGKYVFLPQATLKRLLNLLSSREFNFKVPGTEYNNVRIVEEDLPLQFALDKDKENGDLLLRWERFGLAPVTFSGEYIFYRDRIYKISEQQRECFMPLLDIFIEFKEGIRFPREQQERFVASMLTELKQAARVEIAPEVRDSLCEAGLKTEIYLDKDGEAVSASVYFIYGDMKINPFGPSPQSQAGDKIPVRDAKQENAVLNILESAGFHAVNGTLYLEEEERIYELVYHYLPELQETAEVYYSENFRNMRVRSARGFNCGVRLNGESDMLEFSFQLGDIDQEELGGILKSLREKRKYHRLKDGSFLPLENPGPGLEKAAELVDTLDVSQNSLEQGTVEMPKIRALFVDSAAKESGVELKMNGAFEQLVSDITGARHREFEIPEAFKGVLRNYQQTGFNWLKTLAAYGFGGILADDMGLGKTIQALAFIVSEMREKQLPALVIAPTSMIYNWQDEAQKFAPELKTTVISGTPGERKKQLEEAGDCDLVITSYSLLKKDIELYGDFNFSCCFLDEAQHIKNPGAQSAKAVKKIKSGCAFALTGTPLENNLTELWSIFDFIMPGYLHSRQKFSKKYERPIVKEQNQWALEKLQKQITPFVLRRMKTEVLQELPPKFESKVPTELTREQKKVYLTYLQEAKGEIEQALAHRGWEKSQIKILSVLTRLRQICCHPATFLENYQGGSGKLQSLKEIMEDGINSGHRILLFSQFTGMLEIIRQQLEQMGISYFYLDGATKAEKRGEMVNSFNEGERQAFLVSLKAGGTGLNLTGADMVIHYDPWWNPAVEEQATDRAYRIGQKNPVQVINLVTRGTIEEKIYELQQKKKEMINSVIKPGETMLAQMTEQELKELFTA